MIPSASAITFIRRAWSTDGGGERYVAALLTSQAQRHPERRYTLLTQAWPDEPAAPPNVQIVRLPDEPRRRARRFRLGDFEKAAQAWLAKHPQDLVQTHERLDVGHILRLGDGLHRCWLSARAASEPRWRRWWLAHAPFHRAMLDQEARALMGHSDRWIVCPSAQVQAEVQDYFPQVASRTCVIRNGVDTDRFHPTTTQERFELRRQAGLHPDEVVLLFVGSGWQRKGLDRLIDGLARVPPRQGWQLLVAGHDSQAKRYQAQAARLGLSRNVHFLGRITDPAPWYRLADLFVLPSRYDPCANSVLEALASGTPVLVSDTCGHADLLEGQTAGWALSPDSGEFLDVLLQCLRTPGAIDSRRVAARQLALSQSWAGHCARYGELHRNLLTRPA